MLYFSLIDIFWGERVDRKKKKKKNTKKKVRSIQEAAEPANYSFNKTLSAQIAGKSFKENIRDNQLSIYLPATGYLR